MSIVNRLAVAIDSSETFQLLLDSASGFPTTPGIVQIESEKIHYVVSGPNQLLTLTRAYSSTSAATHAAGLIITFVSNDEPSGSGDLLGTAPVAVSGGSQTLVGSNATVSMAAATDSVDGYMTATDHETLSDAVPETRTVNGHALTGNVTVTNSDLGAVPTTTSVNGHALSGNVTVTSGDVNALDLTAGGTVAGTVTLDKSLAILVYDRASIDSPITLDARLVTNVDVNVDGDLTINGPTNGFEMQKVTFQLRQAGHAVTFATGAGNFLFNTTFASFTSSASGVDYVEATWCPDSGLWNITNIVKA